MGKIIFSVSIRLLEELLHLPDGVHIQGGQVSLLRYTMLPESLDLLVEGDSLPDGVHHASPIVHRLDNGEILWEWNIHEPNRD